MKILFSGSSSFTGFWFIKKLIERGHTVVATYSSSEYLGVRKRRVDLLRGKLEQVFDCPYGEDKFFEIMQGGYWDVYCHHYAYTENYKSPDFDFNRALETNTKNLLKIRSGKVVLTGSYYEFSPYGLSKKLTRKAFEKLQIPLKHFVIPNPFGPYEENRFTNYLIEQWKKGAVGVVKTPQYVRDNIHVEALADEYAKFCENSLPQLSPSGYCETQLAFAQRFSREMENRLKMPCEVDCEEQKVFDEPIMIANKDPVLQDPTLWDTLAEYYLCQA